MRILSGIFAHPDDETFSAGGTFSRYGAAGVRCTLFCATDGAAGQTSGLSVGQGEELAALRRGELHTAARILGIRGIETPGHPDGALGAVNQDELIGQIVRHFRSERPQVVITFGPEGAPNLHADHRAISRAATAAFFLTRLPTAYPGHLSAGLDIHEPARLYYVTWPAPGPTAALQTQGLAPTARLDVRRYLNQELEAFAAHVSQQAFGQRFQEMSSTDEELFTLAAGVPQPAALVDDLFAGLL